FASVDEHYELLLPTRKPINTKSRPKARYRRAPRLRAQSGLKGLSDQSKRRPGRNWRMVLIITGMLLCGAALTTVSFVPDRLPHPSKNAASQKAANQAVDFEAIVASLARARTGAGATVDASLASADAGEGSPV